MKQFNYPTTILFGEGAIAEGAKRISQMGFNSPLVVADQGLVDIGLTDNISVALDIAGLQVTLFTDVAPNPVEDNVIAGAKVFKDNKCDCIVALGGGSPMDAAKGIMIAATHEGPLAQFDDAKGGDKLIVNPLPKLFAIPTSAGTGSEVGRAGVITIKESNTKTILFHPTLLPTVAILEPSLTVSLPKNLTVATGLDAFTHSLEAFLAPNFHPMADGIALEGMRLVIENLPIVVTEPKNLEARGKMMMAATMGATAFQKGLGMIHSLAHPLSSESGLHHGLANTLVGPECIKFIESQKLQEEQIDRLQRVRELFVGSEGEALSALLNSFYGAFDIQFGLRHHGVREDQIDLIGEKAFADVSHQTNMVPVNQQQLTQVLREAF